MKVWGRTSLLLMACASMVVAQSKDHRQAAQHQTDAAATDTARLEWVKHLNSNTASSIDIAVDVAIDASGSVYVTGKSESPEAGNDYLTIKYTAAGQEVWRAYYDGPAHADDVPAAIAVDANGNVYVTGMSMGVGTDPATYDYATVMYDASGNQEWVARYSAPGFVTDAAAAIAVDAGGNVFVTGESDFDIATIKYSPDGTQQWVARYSGTGSVPYTAADLVIDASGNVFVAGGSFSTGWENFPQDFTMIKYTPSGGEQWTAHIAFDSSFGSIAGLGVDNSGSVYIAGSVQHSYNMGPSGSHVITAKFNSAGQQQWLHSYDTTMNYLASSLAIDLVGNVFVSGVGGGDRVDWFWGRGYRTLIMKYSTTGDLLWSRDHQIGLVKLSDMAFDIAGNIYVTGSKGYGSSALPLMGDSIVTMKYDGNGALLWTEYYRGVAGSENHASGITLDNSGNVVVAGASGTSAQKDFVTITYQSSGVMQRDVYATDEGSSFELVSDMALDATGNVYITGSTLDANTSYDFFTAKFNPQGDQLWRATYDGPASRADHPSGIVLDRLGNVYVTGSSTGVGTSKDWATIKYSSSGIQQWVSRYNGTANQDDEAHLLAVDSALNLYVAGGENFASRLTTIKYNVSGLQQWAASYDSTNFVARPGGLRVDKNGNVYVASPPASSWNWYDAVALKYSSLGNEILRLRGGNDILVDDSLNIYITKDLDIGWTNKYDPSGVEIWQANVGGSNMEFDGSGDILLQTFYGGIVKITKGGVFQWGQGIQPIDFAFGFSIDGQGNAYVSGFSASGYSQPIGNYSAKISPTGSIEWRAQYTPGNFLLMPEACRVDASGNVYIAGSSQTNNFSNVATILKYAQITVSVGEEGSELPGTFSLSQNYPNPFNPATNIKFQIPSTNLVTLKVFDVLGREVATLVNEEKTAGTYSAQWNAGSVASGVYFYRLKAGEYNETRKLLLVK